MPDTCEPAGSYAHLISLVCLFRLTPRPNVLTLHFFLVAIHAVRLTLREKFSMKSMVASYDFIRTACEIIM